MKPLVYVNGSVVYREGKFYARPWSAPAYSAVNEYGPFELLEDAEKALEDAP